MAIDFAIPDEAQALRKRIRAWVHDECMPAEKRLIAGEDYKKVLAELRKKARAQGSGARSFRRNTAAWGSGRSPMRWCRWNSARAISARCR
jgi:hypothetical protein